MKNLPAIGRDLFIPWTGFIFVISLIPGNQLPPVPHFMDLLQADKLLHFMLFIVLALTAAACFAPAYHRQKLRLLPEIPVLIYGILIAIITETLQYLLPLQRSGNVYDLIADVGGLLIGCLIVWGHRKKVACLNMD